MMESKKGYAGILYIDVGFLDTGSVYNKPPTYNSSYPDAWATTYAPVSAGDVIECEELYSVSGQVRIRQYYTYGNMTSNRDVGHRITIKQDGIGYVRLMLINNIGNPTIPKKLTVTHPNGTIDTYKIIDRR